MHKIHLTTFIKAPVERVFDLSRNLTIFKATLQNRKEKFTSGAGASLVDQGDTLTLHAKHLGKNRVMTARVVELSKGESFVEEQVKGDLKSFRHERHFKTVANGTILIDLLEFEGPRDMMGSFFSKFYLKTYLEKLVRHRNEVIRKYAETEKWRAVLG
jgi:ligand-binding SRPBCC domain-containing protein